MNEKAMIDWARKRSEAEHAISMEEARIQMDEREQREAEKLQEEMRRRGVFDPQRVVQILRDEAKERHEAALRQEELRTDQEDAEELELINEWRAEDGLPLLSSLTEASADELEAAFAGNARLLLRRA